MYHKVDRPAPGTRHLGNYVLPESFEAQLAQLKRWNFQSITIDEWIAYVKREARLPTRPVIITFDDGYRSTYQTAWPTLQRYGFSATVFLVSRLLGKTNAWDADEGQEQLLNEREIREMQRGGITFGSHTESHRALTKLPLGDVVQELAESRNFLESLLQQRVTSLCYPFAKQNRAIRRLAQQAGYDAAVIGRGGTNKVWTNLFALRRIKLDLATPIDRLGRLLRRRPF